MISRVLEINEPFIGGTPDVLQMPIVYTVDDYNMYTPEQSFLRILAWQERVHLWAPTAHRFSIEELDEWMRTHEFPRIPGDIPGMSLADRHRQYSVRRLEGLTHSEAEAVMVGDYCCWRLVSRYRPTPRMRLHARNIMQAYLQNPREFVVHPDMWDGDTDSDTVNYSDFGGGGFGAETQEYSDMTSLSPTQEPSLSDTIDFPFGSSV